MKVKACVMAGFLAGLLSGAASAEGPPAVVASIKPVHSLVAGVMQGVGAPHLLVKGGGSPHSYAMKPSEARMLEDAQLVFWIGDEFEIFLARPIDALARDAHVASLSRAEGLTLLSTRPGGAWTGPDHEEHEHQEADEHGHDDDHGGHAQGETDMHLWLDPQNARAMVEAIVAELAEVDPERAESYRANGAALREQLRALDAELSARLAAVRGKPYVVFHDGYQYFESRYGLSPVGSVTVSPEQMPGAARLSEIRDKLRETVALCVFTEPQFPPRLAETVIEGSGARMGVLDPLGAEIPDGPELYFVLLRGLAEDLRSCLLAEG